MSFRYLTVILEFLFCWLMYDSNTFMYIRWFWVSEITMAFFLYFRTYCMIKEFFKEKWFGQWELWTLTKTSTQALCRLAETVSRALASEEMIAMFSLRIEIIQITLSLLITHWFLSQTSFTYSAVFLFATHEDMIFHLSLLDKNETFVLREARIRVIKHIHLGCVILQKVN